MFFSSIWEVAKDTLSCRHHQSLVVSKSCTCEKTMAEIVIGAMGSPLPKLANLIKVEYNLQKKLRG